MGIPAGARCVIPYRAANHCHATHTTGPASIRLSIRSNIRHARAAASSNPHNRSRLYADSIKSPICPAIFASAAIAHSATGLTCIHRANTTHQQ